jgi:hypothetical protein
MSLGDQIIITSSVARSLGNTTTYTVVSNVDYDSRYKQNDVTMTTGSNAGTVNELSSYDVFRIVSFWILFVIGVIGNLLVVILVIWKRNRKQVSLV